MLRLQFNLTLPIERQRNTRDQHAAAGARRAMNCLERRYDRSVTIGAAASNIPVNQFAAIVKHVKDTGHLRAAHE